MSTNEIQTKARELKELKLMQEELVCGEYKLTYQTVTSAPFDSTRFKKDHAELATAYTKAPSYRRFSVR